MLHRPTHSRRRAELKAERDRRLRVRRKSGRACYTLELGPEVLDMAIKLHWLTEAEALDKKTTERALAEMMNASART